MKKVFIVCFLILESLYGYQTLQELFQNERCVVLLPDDLEDMINVSYDLDAITGSRFKDMHHISAQGNMSEWQEFFKMGLDDAIAAEKFIPYLLAIVPSQLGVEKITIAEYLKKLSPDQKEEEKNIIAHIMAHNSIAIEMLLYELYQKNSAQYKSIDIHKYEKRVQNIARSQKKIIFLTLQELEKLENQNKTS